MPTKNLCLRVVALLVLACPACRVTDVTLWTPPEPPPEACAVERVCDLAYNDSPEASKRQRLDLFLPRGRKDFPVVFLVHGGSWMMGDKHCCGLYASVGECLARHGIGAVLPNYRLSPGVKHPEHVRDVARALAWTKAHIAEHGGRAEQLFLCGHSAGGHLVSLLATDEKYLQDEGLKTSDIKGVIAVSGVYEIAPGTLQLTLGGPGENALRLSQLLPLRGPPLPLCARQSTLPGIPFKLNIFAPAFSNDPRQRADASPIAHVRPGLPPFLIVHAENDLPTLSGLAERFHTALREQGCEASLLRVAERNHHTIIYSAIHKDDPVAAALLGFVRKHVDGNQR